MPAAVKPTTSHLPYRADIDGLRAIAVGAVLLFHAFPTLLRGGFVGVDIFFIISGFLISGIILKDLDRGKFSYVTFYARRARRLLPALLSTFALTALASWWVLYPFELKRYGHELLYSAGFLANIEHLNEAGGYFGARSDQMVLLHLWSLGVEEQFYLLWPLALTFAYVFARRLVPIFLGIGVVGSFLLSLYLTPRIPDAAFYLPYVRFWELGFGAILATAESRIRPGIFIDWLVPKILRSDRRRAASYLSFLGLGLILYSILELTGEMPFPGYAALAPTLGALLCISAGNDSWVSQKIFSARPFVYVGKISYPLYLWHWPILAFLRILSPSPPSTLCLLAALALAVLAADLTYRFIEAPFRERSERSPAVAVLALVLLLFAGVGFSLSGNFIKARLDTPRVEALERARKDWTYPGAANFQKQSGFTAVNTSAGTTRPEVTVFIGDSHIDQYWPRIKALTEGPVPARQARFLTSEGCLPLPGVNRAAAHYGCDKFLQYAFEQAQDPAVDTVVISAFWEQYFLGTFDDPTGHAASVIATDDPSRKALALDSPETQKAFARLEATIARLEKSGHRVFIILSSPAAPELDPLFSFPNRLKLDPEHQVPSSAAASISRPGFVQYVAPLSRILQAIADRTGAIILDPVPAVCGVSTCNSQADDGLMLYKDHSHLGAQAVARLGGFLDITVTGN